MDKPKGLLFVAACIIVGTWLSTMLFLVGKLIIDNVILK